MFRALACLAAAVLLYADEFDERARRIHQSVIAADSHIDTSLRVLMDHADLSRRSTSGHVDIPRLQEAGVRAPVFALWAPTFYEGSEAIRRTLQLRDAMQRVFDEHPELIELALDASDVERLARQGKIAALLSVEGGHQIADDLAVLRMYYRMGVRSMTLTHFKNNHWADSSTDTAAHNGLTDFGKEVVREMNRLGMIVDVSHVSDKTFYDTLAVTAKPVMASHSSCRAISPVPRNMSDDMIRALARNGGLIGINFGEGFISPKDAERLRLGIRTAQQDPPKGGGKALDDYAERTIRTMLKPDKAEATIDDVVRHIDHVVRLVGVDHAGIGSDYDGIGAPPQGLEDISKLPRLTAALLRKGYSEQDVRKILGGNFLRLLRQVTGR